MRHQFSLVQGLGKKSHGAALCRIHGVGNGSMRSNDQHRQPGPTLLDDFQELGAVRTFHAEIGND